MRVIRFRSENSLALLGEDHGDGSATLLLGRGEFNPDDATATALSLLRGQRALVADDDENMRRLVSVVLESIGCTCTLCFDGAQAMAAIEQERPQLIVTDIRMPHHSGYEIFTAARRMHSNVPILLITGFGYDPSHTLMKVSEDTGESIVLYKPFTPEQLRTEIGHALQESIPRSERFRATNDRRHIRRLLAPVEPDRVLTVAPSTPAREGSITMTEDPVSRTCGPDEPVDLAAMGVIAGGAACHADLAGIISAAARHVEIDDALNHLLGFTAVTHLTAHGATRESNVGICCLGPALLTPEDEALPDNPEVTTRLNGEIVDTKRIQNLRDETSRLIARLSAQRELPSGAIVMLGTALCRAESGSSALRLAAGDTVSVEVPGVGSLSNRIGDGVPEAGGLL